MTDPIADLLTRIRNAQQAHHTEVKIPFSRLKLEMVKLLYQEGLIGAYRNITEEESRKWIELNLRYVGKKEPMMSQLKRVSRPGRRVYVGYEKIKLVRNGLGLSILSTSKGLMTDRQAKEAKLGGELLCNIW